MRTRTGKQLACEFGKSGELGIGNWEVANAHAVPSGLLAGQIRPDSVRACANMGRH